MPLSCHPRRASAFLSLLAALLILAAPGIAHADMTSHGERQLIDALKLASAEEATDASAQKRSNHDGEKSAGNESSDVND